MDVRFVSCAAFAVALFGTAASAATKMDGTLPIYPNVTPVGFSWSDPKMAMVFKHGSTLMMYSPDAMSTLDGWYRGKLPACKHQSGGPHGFVFQCGGEGFVRIAPHGSGSMLVVAPETR